jgi:hypothetical protein
LQHEGSNPSPSPGGDAVRDAERSTVDSSLIAADDGLYTTPEVDWWLRTWHELVEAQNGNHRRGTHPGDDPTSPARLSPEPVGA